MRCLLNLVVLMLAGIATAAVAVDYSARTYPLPDTGHLKLSVPTSWQDEICQPAGRLPPTITFTPEVGVSFEILLTPMLSIREGMVLPESQRD